MLVQKKLETLDNSDFEGPIDAIIAMLHGIKARYPGKNLRIIREGSYYDNDYEFRLICEREETDKERTTRLKEESRNKEAQLRYQREQYEKLKKVFEGQS